MTDKEKYDVLLAEIGALLAGKNTEIAILKYRVADLENKLKAAESAEHDKIETR